MDATCQATATVRLVSSDVTTKNCILTLYMFFFVVFCGCNLELLWTRFFKFQPLLSQRVSLDLLWTKSSSFF